MLLEDEKYLIVALDDANIDAVLAADSLQTFYNVMSDVMFTHHKEGFDPSYFAKIVKDGSFVFMFKHFYFLELQRQFVEATIGACVEDEEDVSMTNFSSTYTLPEANRLNAVRYALCYAPKEHEFYDGDCIILSLENGNIVV